MTVHTKVFVPAASCPAWVVGLVGALRVAVPCGVHDPVPIVGVSAERVAVVEQMVKSFVVETGDGGRSLKMLVVATTAAHTPLVTDQVNVLVPGCRPATGESVEVGFVTVVPPALSQAPVPVVGSAAARVAPALQTENDAAGNAGPGTSSR